jgi:hypothetical protein
MADTDTALLRLLFSFTVSTCELDLYTEVKISFT